MSYNVEFPMIKGRKTDVVKEAGVDYSSRLTDDYVGVLNRISKSLGAVANMGIYADITNITGCTMLKVSTCEHYLTVTVSSAESPKKTLTKSHNVSSVEEANLDMFAGDKSSEGILDGTIENHRCDPTVVCEHCNGSGKCDTCDGNGKKECHICHGDKECHHCNGEGYTECYYCNGTGDCPSCDGTGWSNTVCPDCDGRGKVKDEDTGRIRNCTTCDGHGVLPCSDCATSSSRLEHRPGKCKVCDGKGDLKCTYCGGSGKCQECNGKGTVRCKTCNGSGKCLECKGTGKLKCPRCEGSGWYQTYMTYMATHVMKDNKWVSNTDYGKALDKATGRVVFSGRNKKWKKKDVLEYDHSDRFRAAVASAFGGDARVFDIFAAEHEKTVKKRNGIRYCSEAEATVVPAVRIDFMLEHVPHSMVIMGTNGVVVHDTLPGKLEQYHVGLFRRIGMQFNRNKRHMEYIKLAAYIMQTDGRSPEESRLMNAFVRSLGYSNRKTKHLMTEMERFDASMDYNTLREEIPHLLKTKRVLAFAWQCMLRDGLVSEREETLWQQLAAEFGISEAEQATLRRHAEKSALLTDEALVEEYLRC